MFLNSTFVSNGYASYANGAFYLSDQGHRGWGTDTHDHYTPSIGMSAYNSNNIYGSASTVQPPALKLWLCIKY